MVKYLPSVISATCVLIARKSLRRHPWSPTLVRYTKYDECDLVECVNDMKVFIPNAANVAQLAVYRKYARQSFGGVSGIALTF